MLISSLSLSSPFCLSVSLASASLPFRMGISKCFLNSWAVPVQRKEKHRWWELPYLCYQYFIEHLIITISKNDISHFIININMDNFAPSLSQVQNIMSIHFIYMRHSLKFRDTWETSKRIAMLQKDPSFLLPFHALLKIYYPWIKPFLISWFC